jgi:hypothetical protein
MFIRSQVGFGFQFLGSKEKAERRAQTISEALPPVRFHAFFHNLFSILHMLPFSSFELGSVRQF